MMLRAPADRQQQELELVSTGPSNDAWMLISDHFVRNTSSELAHFNSGHELRKEPLNVHSWLLGGRGYRPSI